MEWSNLLSGLLGALIGAIIGFFGSWYGAKLQINATIKLQRQQENAAFHRRMSNLLEEINDNIELTSRLHQPHSWVKLLNEMWNDAKGDLVKLPPIIQGELRKTYAEIAVYNTLVDNEIAKVHPGQGTLDRPLGEQGVIVKGSLNKSRDSLSGWLNASPQTQGNNVN